MELYIGKNIKALRKARNLTQEQLAESIGVSFQAVSKWENNIALPDITFVPVLAGFFNVTTDELFDYNLQQINADVEVIVDETVRIANKLIDKTTESDIKYDAMRFLAYAYDAKGEKDSAIAVLEQIPEIYFTKLSEMAFILTGKAKFETARKQKWISFEMLLQQGISINCNQWLRKFKLR